MPKINIIEVEKITAAPLDITENVVFLPVVIDSNATVPTGDDGSWIKPEDLIGKFKRYEDVSGFIKDFSNKFVKIGDNYERSYLLAKTYLNYGLKVVVYGVGYDKNADDKTGSYVNKSQSVTGYDKDGILLVIDSGSKYVDDTATLYNGDNEVTTFTRNAGSQEQETITVELAVTNNVLKITNFNDTTDTINIDTVKFDELNEEDYIGSLVVKALDGDTTASPQIPAALDELANKNLYNIKFITYGGYKSGTAAGKTASDRGDCLALIDLEEGLDYKGLESKLKKSDDSSSSSSALSGNKYSAVFFPWCHFELENTKGTGNYLLPGSVAYLLAYGVSVQNNDNWMAASGVSRGAVPNLVAPEFELTEGQMHFLQGDDDKVSPSAYVNPIMMVGSYGYRIWGNRTMDVDSGIDSYFKFLNIRMLLCDIKKTLYLASIRNTFEPNDDVTWINFKAMCAGLLDRMTSGRGLRWYRWKKEKSDKKAQIKATLTISPIEAVEYFDLLVYLTDEEVEVSEEAE